MPTSYVPSSLSALDNWSQNYNTQVGIMGSTHGLSAPQIANLAAVTTSFHDQYALSSAPGTRTPATVAATATARNAMVNVIQSTAMILQSNATMTDELRATFGITVRKTTRTPVPTPVAVPDLSIQSNTTSMVTVRVKTLGSFGSAKPNGASSVRLYRKTGAVAPTSINDAAFIGTMSKRFFTDDMSAVAPGTQVWYIAAFATQTGKIGPASSAITCNVSA
jgi:hypothetical protein